MQNENFGDEPACVLVVSNGLTRPVTLAPYFKDMFRFKLVEHDVDQISDAVSNEPPSIVLFDCDAVSITDVYHILNLIAPYTKENKAFVSFLFAKKRGQDDGLPQALRFEQVSLEHNHLEVMPASPQTALLSLRSAINTTVAQHDEDVRLKERRHIAREVHDELGQLLSCIRLRLFEFESGKATSEQVSAMYALIDKAQMATRDIVRDLRTNVTPRTDLVTSTAAKLESLAAEFSNESGVPYVLKFKHTTDYIQTEVAEVLIRTLQESLTNVMRYAKARQVIINLTQKQKEIVLTVQDDGIGFDPNNLAKRNISFGLVGMKERAALLGGEVRVLTKHGKGTTVTVKLPCKRHQDIKNSQTV